MRSPYNPPQGSGASVTRHGNRSTCATCGKPITAKRGSRRLTYCSESCRKRADRNKASGSKIEAAERANWVVLAAAPDPSGSVGNTPTNSAACKGQNGDRPPALDRAELIRRAIESERAARWPVVTVSSRPADHESEAVSHGKVITSKTIRPKLVGRKGVPPSLGWRTRVSP